MNIKDLENPTELDRLSKIFPKEERCKQFIERMKKVYDSSFKKYDQIDPIPNPYVTTSIQMERKLLYFFSIFNFVKQINNKESLFY